MWCIHAMECFCVFLKIIYFWLRWVFIARRGLSLAAEWGLLFLIAVRGLLFAVASLCCGAWALCVQASVVVAHEL